jgi:hypothetical protein
MVLNPEDRIVHILSVFENRALKGIFWTEERERDRRLEKIV